MNKAKRFIFSLSTLIFFSGMALAAAPAYARGGSSGGGSNDAVEATSTTDNSSNTGTETETEVETHGQTLAEQFREQAKANLAGLKSQHTLAQRQKACEARQANLTNRMANAVRTAKTIKGVIDDKYTKVQDFYTSKSLNVTNYQTLKDAVDTAQAAAADSISALQATNTTIDCTSGNAAETVSAFRTAVGNTRDSLKAYRKALIALITQIHGASTSTTKTDQTDNTAQTNTTNSNQ
jgi:lysyl-tRNA synthetase class II